MNNVTAASSTTTEDAEHIETKNRALALIRTNVTGDAGKWTIREIAVYALEHGFEDVPAVVTAFLQYGDEYRDAIEYRDAEGTTIQGVEQYCNEHGLDFVNILCRADA